MITLEDGIDLVWKAFSDMEGGEIYIRKIPSITIGDIARAVNPEAEHEIVGIRPGEKLHEQMIGTEDAPYTFEYDTYYKVLPAINGWSLTSERIKDGVAVSEDFVYSSETNTDWMSVESLQAWIAANADKLGTF